jgi:uncharacterized protein
MAPQRTCVACRETTEADDLVRLVLHPVEERVLVDLPGKLPGRGAWVHARRACVERLDRAPERLVRPLRTRPPVRFADGSLDATLRARILQAARDGLSLASASGSLVSGQERLAQALRGGAVRWVATASDASPRTLDALRAAAPPEVCFVELDLDRVALGDRIGRGVRAAVGVRSTRGAAHLRLQLRRLADLG